MQPGWPAWTWHSFPSALPESRWWYHQPSWLVWFAAHPIPAVQFQSLVPLRRYASQVLGCWCGCGRAVSVLFWSFLFLIHDRCGDGCTVDLTLVVSTLPLIVSYLCKSLVSLRCSGSQKSFQIAGPHWCCSKDPAPAPRNGDNGDLFHVAFVAAEGDVCPSCGGWGFRTVVWVVLRVFLSDRFNDRLHPLSLSSCRLRIR